MAVSLPCLCISKVTRYSRSLQIQGVNTIKNLQTSVTSQQIDPRVAILLIKITLRHTANNPKTTTSLQFYILHPNRWTYQHPHPKYIRVDISITTARKARVGWWGGVVVESDQSSWRNKLNRKHFQTHQFLAKLPEEGQMPTAASASRCPGGPHILTWSPLLCKLTSPYHSTSWQPPWSARRQK